MANTKRGRRQTTPEEKKQSDKNYRPDRDGYGSIQAPESTPRKPSWLKREDKLASDFWDKYIPELIKMGHVTSLDVPQLTSMCQWWSRFQRLQRQDDAKESDISTACNQFKSSAKLFGLSPLDRQRLRSWKPPEKKDEFEAFQELNVISIDAEGA